MKKAILFIGMLFGFSILMTSCTTDEYDQQIETSVYEIDNSSLNRDGDDGTTDTTNTQADETDPIVKPKKD
ncbi:hypothetical protein LXD69_04730 [Flavobacterium sediminilitoris]|uniref:Secreted protein n=1 Tax=Flavobacterium sediminilitoris TaxID=2024526 RepID=A0ABY4HRH9_9FLAO|nr:MULTISPECIES: hypothetical protein [Flavobacterium]UOX34816.1 hypothetical protein LXD69_04730 [Flavobacterium sediminilitoris]